VLVSLGPLPSFILDSPLGLGIIIGAIIAIIVIVGLVILRKKRTIHNT
jgi:hypothetical protein